MKPRLLAALAFLMLLATSAVAQEKAKESELMPEGEKSIVIIEHFLIAEAEREQGEYSWFGPRKTLSGTVIKFMLNRKVYYVRKLSIKSMGMIFSLTYDK